MREYVCTLKKTMNLCKKTPLLAATLLPLTAFSQTLVFNTGFDYPNGAPAIDELADDLDGAEGQIGTFSGFLPLGEGGLGGEQVITLRATNEDPPNTYLVADRATADFAFSAVFAAPIEIINANISFQIATSRTGPDHNKDNEIIGFSASGEEVFHLWVSARNDAEPDGLRLGFESSDTEGIQWNIPTSFGADASGDIGFFNGDVEDSTINLPSTFRLALGANGFQINFSSGGLGGSGGDSLGLYQSRNISYNGTGTDLARIEFRGQGGDNNDLRGGFWLDDLTANGVLVPEPPFVLRITDYDFNPETRSSTVRFTSEENIRYRASRSTDLLTWEPISAVMVRVGSETTFVDSNIPADVTKRFYRVEEEVPN